MELDQAIKNRRSIRKFLKKEVERDKIKKLIEAAQYAPSWKNKQVSKYYVIDTPEIKEKFLEKCLYNFNHKNMVDAPVIIACTVVDGVIGVKNGEYETPIKDGYQYFDNGLQVQNLCLKAYEMGLGTLIMGLYDFCRTRTFFNIPNNEKLTVLIGVGYPDINPDMPPRKRLDEILKFYN